MGEAMSFSKLADDDEVVGEQDSVNVEAFGVDSLPNVVGIGAIQKVYLIVIKIFRYYFQAFLFYYLYFNKADMLLT